MRRILCPEYREWLGDNTVCSPQTCPRLGPISVVDYNDPAYHERQPYQDPDDPLPDPNQLAGAGRDVTGMAADGVTPVLIRTPPIVAPGRASIRVRDREGHTGPEYVGQLCDPLTGAEGNPLVVAHTSWVTSSNHYQAFATLTAPMDFVRPGYTSDEYMGSRDLTIEVVYTLETGRTLPMITKDLELVRPPVVLIHGVSDSGECFEWDIIRDTYGRFQVTRADYEATHEVWLNDNKDVAPDWIYGALERMRRRGIAATQADVFAHSMGGLITRLAMQNTPVYIRDGWPHPPVLKPYLSNFGRGDIHKFVTVHTPHWGSTVSNYLMNADNTITARGDLVRRLMKVLDDPRDFTGGAFVDMRTDSPMIRQINSHVPAVAVPTRVFVGSDVVFGAPDGIGRNALDFWKIYILRLSCEQQSIEDLFPDPMYSGANDLVVGLHSQMGGLAGDVVKNITGRSAWHRPSVHDYQDLNTEAIAALNAPTTSTMFCSGFPQQSPFAVYPGPAECDVPLNLLLTPGLVLLGVPQAKLGDRPGKAALVKAGTGFDVLVESGASFVPEGVLLCTSAGTVMTKDAPPYSFAVEVPPEFLGEFGVSAFAFNADGTWTTSPTEVVEVTSSAAVTDLHVDLPSLFLTPVTCEQGFRVIGGFSDGVSRDVTTGATGTTYAVTNTGVAEMVRDGRVRAVGAGETEIIVTNSGESISLPVVVTGACDAPLPTVFVRGDIDQSGTLDISDPIYLLAWLILPGNPQPVCRDAADLDDSGSLDISDAIGLLAWLFVPGTPEPYTPFLQCGPDPTMDGLDCSCSAACGPPCPAPAKASSGSAEAAQAAVGVAEMRSDGTVAVSVTLKASSEVLGAEIDVAYPADALEFQGAEQLPGRPFAFHSARAVDGRVRLGMVPDLRLESALPPGNRDVALLRFHRVGPDDSPWTGGIRVVGGVVVDRSMNRVPLGPGESQEIPDSRVTTLALTGAGHPGQPANPYPLGSILRLESKATGVVVVAIYDVHGGRVRTLLEGAQGPGVWDLVWDGRSSTGVEAPTGMYYLRATSGVQSLSHGFVMIR